MVEIPEASVLATQIAAALGGRRILRVEAGGTPHKLAWFYGEPTDVPAAIEPS